MKITITVLGDGNNEYKEVARRESTSFETAAEDLGKLERFMEKFKFAELELK